MQAYLLVFLGGGIGSALRHAVNLAMPRLLGPGFPYHTLFANLTGCLVMGLMAGYFAFRGDAPQWLRLFLTTGIVGGYTTFSAFSLDAALLWERSQYLLAAAYVLLSVAGSLGRCVAWPSDRTTADVGRPTTCVPAARAIVSDPLINQ